MHLSKETTTIYLRNFLFGVEDSLISTTGLLSGIAVAGIAQKEIFVTGMVLIFVEAFSMGIGSFLTEESTQEYIKHAKAQGRSITAGFIMFLSYFCSGLIPLLPYAVFDISFAFGSSVFLSLFALFILGVVGAKAFKSNIIKSGIRMLAIGGVAVIGGVLIGIIIEGRSK